jgi:hypothetical protein
MGATRVDALLDPVSREPRYVGKTMAPLAVRLDRHIRDARKGKPLPPNHGLRRKGVRTLSPEVRALLRAQRMGNTRTLGDRHTPESRKRMSAAHTGRKASPETCARISAARTGVKCTPEHCANMGAARRGVKQSPEGIAKRTAGQQGRKASDEARAHLSAAQRIATARPEYRAKLGEALRGKKKSPEHIANWRASRWGKVLHGS